jgi:hypothetical protein
MPPMMTTVEPAAKMMPTVVAGLLLSEVMLVAVAQAECAPEHYSHQIVLASLSFI